METFGHIIGGILSIFLLIVLAFLIIYFQGLLLVWLHTAIHPASLAAGGNPWVYGVTLAILQSIFKPNIPIFKTNQK